MTSGESIQNLISTNVMGDHNTVNTTLNVTYNVDSSGGMRPTDSSQTTSASSGASYLASNNVGNIHELITDETKCNAEVKEIEITWLAKEVAGNGRFCDKRESLYRHLSIPDQEIRKIKQERLDRRRVNIEDEVFKVVNIGWRKRSPTKTRNCLIKHLLPFNKTLAQAYAEYINNCNDFEIGLPLPLPGSVNRTNSTATSPSIQGPASLLPLPSPSDITAVALSSLSIQRSSSVDGSQAVQSSTPPIQLGADVGEDEIVWLSGKVAGGYQWERDSLYRHLNILDSEVETIKYEKLGEDRNIENEIFKVVQYGWYLQGVNRTRALLFRQLLTFKKPLAEDYLKYVDNQFEDTPSGH